MNPQAYIRQQVHCIESCTLDLEILLNAVFEKIDGMGELSSSATEAVSAINCFAKCALRNAALVRENCEHILALTSETAPDRRKGDRRTEGAA